MGLVQWLVMAPPKYLEIALRSIRVAWLDYKIESLEREVEENEEKIKSLKKEE